MTFYLKKAGNIYHDQWNEGYSLSLLPVLQLVRFVHSRW